MCVLLPLENFGFYIGVVNSSRRNVLKEGLRGSSWNTGGSSRNSSTPSGDVEMLEGQDQETVAGSRNPRGLISTE